METNVEEKKYEYLPLGISGLGGWLVLVQIGLYGAILLLLVQFFQYMLPVFSPDVWEALTFKDSEFYHPLWEPLLISETVVNLLTFIFCIYILVMFYGKKAILPRLMIIFSGAGLLISLLDYVLLNQIPLAQELEDGSSIKDLIRTAISCAIWIPYFLKSKRVKNTFVR